MPNMSGDGFLDEALYATQASSLPTNSDFNLQNAVAAAIATQACLGNGAARTVTVNVATWATANVNDSTQRNDPIQRVIQRLTNLGYTASLSGTTLTVNWP